MKTYCLVLLFMLTSAVWGQPPVPNDSVAANQFVWTDSLIANRGPFATAPPPESFKPDTIDGKLYWHGGVFVLPVTPDSVLLANGFRDVAKKPGSVMHDYFEASWPVGMKLETLPLAIRQVRYYQNPMGFPPSEDWARRETPGPDGIFYQVNLYTILGLPDNFFKAYGIKQHGVKESGWNTMYQAYWPKILSMKNAPQEFYNLSVDPFPENE